MLTPYIAQVLLKTSLYSAISVYSVIGKSLVLDVLIQLQQNLDTSKIYLSLHFKICIVYTLLYSGLHILKSITVSPI